MITKFILESFIYRIWSSENSPPTSRQTTEASTRAEIWILCASFIQFTLFRHHNLLPVSWPDSHLYRLLSSETYHQRVVQRQKIVLVEEVELWIHLFLIKSISANSSFIHPINRTSHLFASRLPHLFTIQQVFQLPKKVFEHESESISFIFFSETNLNILATYKASQLNFNWLLLSRVPSFNYLLMEVMHRSLLIVVHRIVAFNEPCTE